MTKLRIRKFMNCSSRLNREIGPNIWFAFKVQLLHSSTSRLINPSSGSSLVTLTATQWPFGLTDCALSKSNLVATADIFLQA
uniref:ACC1 n=1 Tax=Arundo donax TaxID=35708 RepID=A0A0A9D3P8_ARUDO